ncbi:MAG: NUDIX domain-containing protein [Actinobacteria bacterium]|nr:NUDIX domain-containing protein [Actinomycetota bacterium]
MSAGPRLTPLGAGDEVPLRDAATVLLLRDRAVDPGTARARGGDGAGPPGRGLEVFMLRRNLRSDFVGGAYVFPGGAVDPHDRADDLEGICDGRTDAEASARLGIDRGGLAFWVAAIRESFEEAGVLLATGPGGDLVVLDDPAIGERFVHHRRAVDRGERRLVDVCRDEGLRLAVGGMHYFGHWVTPRGAPRRYDTRFFLAAAPPAQTPLHDDREVIANLWIRPDDALERHRSGAYEMLPPTVASLRAMARFSSTAEALQAAAEIVDVPRVEPRVVQDAGGVRIVLPGDAEYGEGYVGRTALDAWPSMADRSARAARSVLSEGTAAADPRSTT